LRRKNQELENRQEKIMIRWATWLTHIMSYRKIPRDEET